MTFAMNSDSAVACDHTEDTLSGPSGCSSHPVDTLQANVQYLTTPLSHTEAGIGSHRHGASPPDLLSWPGYADLRGNPNPTNSHSPISPLCRSNSNDWNDQQFVPSRKRRQLDLVKCEDCRRDKQKVRKKSHSRFR